MLDFCAGWHILKLENVEKAIGFTPMEKPPRSCDLHGGFLFERCFVKTSQSASQTAPLEGAMATTAASGGNREELLGPRPAGCKRQRSRRWEPQPGQWHRVSDDGEVVLRQSLPSVGKSGSQHRFLYLFVEVYGILILHPVPAH